MKFQIIRNDMHETSLALAILDIVEEYAARENFCKVNSIRLSFGRLTCIEPRSLEFAFEVQSNGSRAEGAKLNFEILPAAVHCLACESESEMDAFPGACPKCGSEHLMVTGGREDLKIIDMDVD